MQEELYKRFSGKMYAVCLRYANNADDAQDLLQEGFIKVYRNLHRFRAEGSFEGWIRRVFVNSSIEHFRKKSLQLTKVSEKEESTIGENDIRTFVEDATNDAPLARDQLIRSVNVGIAEEGRGRMVLKHRLLRYGNQIGKS